MDLTVIVPAYNEARAIVPCLDALRAQLGPGVEAIVADDGSTDGTPDVVARGFPEVRLLRLPHRGSAAARVDALAHARGARIAFLDADCVPDPGWVDAARAGRGIVMGRVRAPGTFRARALALLEFGEFVGDRPGTLANFALLNLAGPTEVFRAVPLPDVRHGHDRLWSATLVRAGHPIRFEPGQSVLHAPALAPRALFRRRVSYARRFAAIRRIDRALPGARLLRLGPLGALLVAAGRLWRDLGRLFRARRALGIGVGLPAYVPVLAAARAVDALVLAGESVRDPADGEESFVTPGMMRHTINLGVSGILSQLLLSLRALLGASALGPALYGMWQGIRYALQASQVSDLGVLDALKREVPVARGRGDDARVAAVRGTAFVVAILGAGAVAGACLLAAPFAGESAPLLVAAAFAALLQQLFAFADADLRAEARLRRSAVAGFVRAVVAAALAFPLGLGLGVEGYAGSIAFGSLAGAGVAFAAAGLPAPRATRAVARELVRTGLPIKIARAVPELVRGADKLLVLALAGATAGGLYGLADTASRFLTMLPWAAGAAVAPFALRRHAETGDPRVLLASFAGPLGALARVLPAVAGLAAILSEPVILALLPRFAGAATATKLLCLTMAAASIEALARNVLIALGRQRAAAVFATGFGALALGLDVAALRAGLGVAGVAAVALLGWTGLSLALTVVAARALGLPRGEVRNALAGSMLRFAYGTAALLAVEILRDAIPGGVWGRSAAFLLLVMPATTAPARRVSAA
jgi:O-antigen/teichoic acid export membrane protein